MKIKYILGILLFVLLFIFILFVFHIKNLDYERVVDFSLNSYYKSGNVDDLEEIVSFIDKYSFHEETVEKTQRYVNKKINLWYKYLDNKYTCNVDDYKVCNLLLDEFNLLNSKVINLYSYKSKKGFKLLIKGDYDLLIDQANKKVDDINRLFEYLEYQKDINHFSNCSLAICTTCSNGLCNCTYVDDSNKSIDIICEQ